MILKVRFNIIMSKDQLYIIKLNGLCLAKILSYLKYSDYININQIRIFNIKMMTESFIKAYSNMRYGITTYGNTLNIHVIEAYIRSDYSYYELNLLYCGFIDMNKINILRSEYLNDIRNKVNRLKSLKVPSYENYMKTDIINFLYYGGIFNMSMLKHKLVRKLFNIDIYKFFDLINNGKFDTNDPQYISYCEYIISSNLNLTLYNKLLIEENFIRSKFFITHLNDYLFTLFCDKVVNFILSQVKTNPIIYLLSITNMKQRQYLCKQINTYLYLHQWCLSLWHDFILYNCPSLYEDNYLIESLFENDRFDIVHILAFDGFKM
jgi:hypothetical protein